MLVMSKTAILVDAGWPRALRLHQVRWVQPANRQYLMVNRHCTFKVRLIPRATGEQAVPHGKGGSRGIRTLDTRIKSPARYLAAP